MNLAKVSANGQITVSAEIRRILGLKPGDKIMFFENNDGEIVINNASAQAIYKAQMAFSGVAESLGIEDDDDVMGLVSEVRWSVLKRKNEVERLYVKQVRDMEIEE